MSYPCTIFPHALFTLPPCTPFSCIIPHTLFSHVMGACALPPFTITRAQGTTTKSLLNLQQEGGRKIRKRVSIKAQQANNAVLFSPERGLANNAYCSHLKEAEHGHQHQEATPFCSSNGVALSSPLPFAITSLLFLAFVNIVFPFTVGLRHEKARV